MGVESHPEEACEGSGGAGAADDLQDLGRGDLLRQCLVTLDRPVGELGLAGRESTPEIRNQRRLGYRVVGRETTLLLACAPRALLSGVRFAVDRPPAGGQAMLGPPAVGVSIQAGRPCQIMK